MIIHLSNPLQKGACFSASPLFSIIPRLRRWREEPTCQDSITIESPKPTSSHKSHEFRQVTPLGPSLTPHPSFQEHIAITMKKAHPRQAAPAPPGTPRPAIASNETNPHSQTPLPPHTTPSPYTSQKAAGNPRPSIPPISGSRFESPTHVFGQHCCF